MMELYRATVIKEIYWHNKTYKQGDPIHIDKDEMQELSDAAVIGDVKPMLLKKEYAVNLPPENAMKQHGFKQRNGKR
jgi:hypothetical protein